MKKYKNGLVVGKFCPLHKGHELLVNKAIEKCEQVFVLSYSDPEFPGCEPWKRKHWITTLFPSVKSFVYDQATAKSELGMAFPVNDAREEEHRKFVAKLWLNLVGCPLDAVFTSENYGEGFASALSRYFRENSWLPPVRHEQVDLERKIVPISGTLLRKDIHRMRDYLSPVVYASFVKRVAFLGGESTGKSTLAQKVAETFNTCFVSEYGRDRWIELNGNLKYEDMLHIAETHIEKENLFSPDANEFLFVDTSPLTTLLYSYHLFGDADPKLVELSFRKYDRIFLCVPDFEFVQDGTRAGEAFRQAQHSEYLRVLRDRQCDFVLLSGSLDDRIGTVKAELRG
jgi:HTH-type transcriptional repressor of NAD biosynthesis genes